MVPKLTAKATQELLREARERFDRSFDADHQNRKNAADDTRFVYETGAQWSQQVKDQRKQAGCDDPMLEFNQCKQFVHQVVNDQRQNRPGIRIHPASGDASEEVAETLQGLIRGIEYASQAEAIYDTGYQQAVVGGRGFWRVISEHESPDSFNQNLKIISIPDPLTVYPDPDFLMPDGSDMNYCFVIDTVNKADLEAEHPGMDVSSWPNTESHQKWIRGDEVVVADYYRRVKKPRTLVALEDGETLWKDEYDQIPEPKPPIVKERESEDFTVEWYTLAGGEVVLKQTEWPGTIIPVVQDLGDTIMVDGKRTIQGLIRQARDSQSLFNFAMSAQAIHLAATPRSPYMMLEGQAEGYEGIYKNANRVSYGFLYYKPVLLPDGSYHVAPPSRNAPSMPDVGWQQMGQGLTGLLRSTMGGLYESSLGMQGQETSGRAITAREKQADNATFHYADNHARAIALTGRIIVELIPHYYDTERIVHLVHEDDERELAKINEQRMVPDETGALVAIKNNDVTTGKYAVVVSSGPSYATKRQEGADMLMQIVQAVPDIMKVAGDIVVRAQEIPDAEILSERLKFLLPPQIQQAEQAKAQGQQQLPAEVQQMLMQAQQATQELQQQLQACIAENEKLKAGDEADLAKQQMANDASLLVAAMNNATKLLMDSMQPEPVGPAEIGPDGQPLPQAQPQRPQVPMGAQMLLVGELTKQVMAMGQQMAAMAKTVSAPRQVTLQMDPMGNPVGAVSTVQ